MKKEDLINKWLDHNLSQKELEAFENSDAFESFQKIDWAASQHKAPEYNVETAWNTFSESLPHSNPTKRSKTAWFKYAASIAAMLLIGFFIFNNVNDNLEIVETVAQNQIEFNLPDASNVTLNLASTITYDAANWNDNRSLNLNGEAFFKVSKGQKFTVNTPSVTVEVLGTQFNVYQRNKFFCSTLF